MIRHESSDIHLCACIAELGGDWLGIYGVFGLLSGKCLNGWTLLFLVTTALTSATGLLFPVEHLLSSTSWDSLARVLALAIVARYAFHMAGAWRTTYVVGAVIALYFNCFRRGRAGLRRKSRAQAPCSNAERTAFPGCALVVLGDLRRAGHHSCQAIPPALLCFRLTNCFFQFGDCAP